MNPAASVTQKDLEIAMGIASVLRGGHGVGPGVSADVRRGVKIAETDPRTAQTMLRMVEQKVGRRVGRVPQAPTTFYVDEQGRRFTPAFQPTGAGRRSPRLGLQGGLGLIPPMVDISHFRAPYKNAIFGEFGAATPNCTCPSGYTLDSTDASGPICTPTDPSWPPEAAVCAPQGATPPGSSPAADDKILGMSKSTAAIVGIAAGALLIYAVVS